MGRKAVPRANAMPRSVAADLATVDALNFEGVAHELFGTRLIVGKAKEAKDVATRRVRGRRAGKSQAVGDLAGVVPLVPWDLRSALGK